MEEQIVHNSISDVNTEDKVKNDNILIPRKKRICLVGEASEDPTLGAAAQQFSVPVLKSSRGVEHIDDTNYCTYFVLKKFEGAEYDILHKSSHRVLGPTALLQLAQKKEALPSISRPMYTQSMLGTVIVFTGFRKKDELTNLINMIHHMGGSIRKEMGRKVTHLIANCCGGEKYRYAVTFRVPIMSMNWVNTLWNSRDDISSFSNNEDLITNYKLKPFVGAKVCFFGFPEEEKKHMCEVLQQQGGEAIEISDPNCTHVVKDLEKQQIKKCDSAMLLPSSFFNKSLDHIDFNFDILSSLPPYNFNFYNSSNDIYFPKSKFNFDSDDFLNIDINKIDENIDSKNSNDSKDYLSICSPLNFNNDSGIFMDSSDDNSSPSPSIDSKFIFDFSEHYNDFDYFENFSTYFPEEIINIDTDSAVFASLNFYDNSSDVNAAKQTSEIFSEYYGSMNNIYDNDLETIPLLKNIKSLTKKKALTPKRCIKWRKSKSCNSLSKLINFDYSYNKYSKINSNSNLSKKLNIYQNLSNNNSTKSVTVTIPLVKNSKNNNTTISKAIKKSSAFLSKLSEILPLNFKQYMTVDPTRKEQQDPEFELSSPKYTPLPSSPLPVPAKMARLSDKKATSTIITPNHNNPTASIPIQFNASSKPRSSSRMEGKFFLVVDESNVNALPDLASARAHMVKAEWFWTSVQNEGAADEKEYLFEDYLESVTSPRRESQQVATPTTASARRKRKRLAETFSLVQNGADSPALHKRRSSVSDAGHLSVSGSFLDSTASPDKHLLDDIPEVESVSTDTIRKNLSPRHQVFLELVQTESNYVGILSTIMTLFKSPLEDLIETNGELLNSTEAKIIFGNFPPIYEVHKKMLEELKYCAARWTEDTSVGNIFLKYSSDLVKAYPPYVNFFENTKEMLDQCDQNKPRFHAFLKICQTKPECGRQSLKELLIKPVQRLPSISLLLNDILKHTSKSNPDHSALEMSLNSIKEVMTYINEDKRKTEGQLVMFDIFNEIDNCPPHLVSSHRSFICKCDVIELSEGLSGRGDHLVLFLFTDTLEICKKRSKAFNSVKSPNTVNGLHTVKMSHQTKPYKHIRLLSLSTIKKVVDIHETDDCQKVFALMVRSNQELKEKLFSFTINDEEVNKSNYLRTLCRQMANTVCKADADTFLISLGSQQLEIDTSDVALGTLSKAFKFASRTRMKVGRAFSFNKTPSKLKRAMSTMMSPFGSTTSLTPASRQLAQMRLASCNNINELGNNGSNSPTRDEVLVAPLSVQPTRKAKCSTLSISSLRRL